MKISEERCKKQKIEPDNPAIQILGQVLTKTEEVEDYPECNKGKRIRNKNTKVRKHIKKKGTGQIQKEQCVNRQLVREGKKAVEKQPK